MGDPEDTIHNLFHDSHQGYPVCQSGLSNWPWKEDEGLLIWARRSEDDAAVVAGCTGTVGVDFRAWRSMSGMKLSLGFFLRGICVCVLTPHAHNGHTIRR